MRNFHLPGFYLQFNLIKSMLEVLDAHPEYLQDDVLIASVYDSFPNANWNGGRVCFGATSQSMVQEITEFFGARDIPMSHTFTNCRLEASSVADYYCNLILTIGENSPVRNGVIVNSPILEQYLKGNYPGYYTISSTTRAIDTVEAFNELLATGRYQRAVLPYQWNNNWDVLGKIENADRVEVLLNESCAEKCPLRQEHYDFISCCQLNLESKPYPECSNVDSFELAATRAHFVAAETTREYETAGISHFKISGRSMHFADLLDVFLYYLFKEEHTGTARRAIVKKMLNR